MKPQINLLMVFAGAAMLLGCTQDPVGKAPGGLEPSASSQQSEDHDEPGSGGGAADSRGSRNGGSGGAY